MALSRSESTLTIADSCASLTPRQTPRKRPYTQVFSTPLATRTDIKRLRPTLSPGPLSFRTVPASSFIEPETPTKRLTTTTTSVLSMHASRHDDPMREDATPRSRCRYDWNLDSLCSPESLCRILHISKALADVLLHLPEYTRVLDLAWLDYRRIVQHEDEDDLEMREIAAGYVWSRHEIRLRRLVAGTRAAESDDEVVADVEQHETLRPPTPPASDEVHEDDDDNYARRSRVVEVPEMPWPPSGDVSPSRHITTPKNVRRHDREDSALPTPESSKISGARRRRSKRLAK